MFIDKKYAARLLLHASIRNVFNGECPVANHVIVMSARQILHEYADAHSIALIHDMRAYLKDQSLAREFEFLWKMRYNFLKHADRDHDEEINIRNVNFLNEMDTLFSVQKYQQMFSEPTGHMKIFMGFLAVMYPDKMKIEAVRYPEAINAVKKISASMSRQGICELFSYGLKIDPQAKAEIEEARELSFKEPVPYSDEERKTVEIRKKRKV